MKLHGASLPQKNKGIWDPNMVQNGGNECLFLHVLFLGFELLQVFLHMHLYIYITIYTSYVSLHHMFHYVICFTASYVSLRHMFHCVICFTAFPAGIQAESEVGSMAIRLAFMLKSPNRAP